MSESIANLAVNTIRTLSIDAVENAKSGHPGLPLGAAPMSYCLFQNHLCFDPTAHRWPNRDRFVLSAGHGSMLLYSLLHLTGYDLSLEDLKKFRQLGSKTPGHPEFGLTPGVEATTGPLGQGFANSVGMAIAERRLAALFNQPDFEIVDHITYCLASDGDLMEGVSCEAASLAGHLKLGKLIVLYDSNDVTLDGPAALAFSENVAQRFESYGWHVHIVEKGDTDLEGINSALSAARNAKLQPSLIIVKTTIGYGSPKKAGSSASHGSPLGAEEVTATKKALGWNASESFYVPQVVREHFQISAQRGQARRREWESLFSKYEKAHPELARLWQQAHTQAPLALETSFDTNTDIATRQASGKVIQEIAQKMPWVIGGDADLSCSTNTLISGGGSFEGTTGKGSNIHFGVREHAMAAIANGICYHGGLRPFVATFFCFFDYLKPALRLSALNHLPVVYVFTHDSIRLGEDGPTHQPIEHLASLRAIPNVHTFRPADATETKLAWQSALSRTSGPTALVLTRQKTKELSRKSGDKADVSQGAWIVAQESRALECVLIATGSEVSLALDVRSQLEKHSISTRVVSITSWEIFSAQTSAFRDSVIPSACRKKVSIEAASTFGWERHVGTDGLCIGIDRFGASAPEKDLLKEFGFTAEAICGRIEKYFRTLAS